MTNKNPKPTSKLHYFPFYYLDWLSSTSVTMMTHEEKGLYIDMICRCYNDDGLPSDEDSLIRLFNVRSTDVLTNVQRMFYEDSNGRLQHEKIDDIKKLQGVKRKQQSEAGKASAAARKARKGKDLEDVTNVPTPVEIPLNENPTIISEQNKADHIISEEEKINKKEVFEVFRKLYPGTRRGLETEFDDFKKHKDWQEVIFTLKEIIEKQIAHKKTIPKGAFNPEWKHLKTWINQRCWEEEAGVIEAGSHPGSDKGLAVGQIVMSEGTQIPDENEYPFMQGIK